MKDSDKVVGQSDGALWFDSKGCGPTEGSVKVRAMVTCGEARVGLMGDAVGGWYLLPEQAIDLAKYLIMAASEAEAVARDSLASVRSKEG